MNLDIKEKNYDDLFFVNKIKDSKKKYSIHKPGKFTTWNNGVDMNLNTKRKEQNVSLFNFWFVVASK